MKNVITLGKSVGLLLVLFCLPLLLLSVTVHTKNARNELSFPVMGTIFLVYTYTNTDHFTPLALRMWGNNQYTHTHRYSIASHESISMLPYTVMHIHTHTCTHSYTLTHSHMHRLTRTLTHNTHIHAHTYYPHTLTQHTHTNSIDTHTQHTHTIRTHSHNTYTHTHSAYL